MNFMNTAEEREHQISNRVIILRDTITEEVFRAMGLKPANILRKPTRGMLKPVTTHFARIAERFVRECWENSISESGQETLKDFSMTVDSRGEQNMPKTGPLLLVSNHPGALDSLALVSRVCRNDVKILVSDSAFMREFAGESPFFIFVDFKVIGGMTALRESIEQLQSGGAVIIFAHGEVEPDPELNPNGAMNAIQNWSPSIEVMLRKVPDTSVQFAIMSGAVLQKFMRSPLVWLRKQSFEKQKLAEFVQVIQQLFAPKSVDIHLNISMSKVFEKLELEKVGIMESVIKNGQALLGDHLQWLAQKA